MALSRPLANRLRSLLGSPLSPCFRQLALRGAVSTASPPSNHSLHFKLERYWAAGMIPVIPTAYFVHGPVMDLALAVVVSLHVHWGISGVMQDYARPIIMGESLASLCRASVYLMSMALFAGLLYFNYNDVGITRAFELVWSL